MITLQLPPMTNGQQPPMLPAEIKSITIIGANGAGKSRFAQWLMTSLDDKAFSVSALKALYGTGNKARVAGAVDRLYAARCEASPLMRPDLSGEFERLVALMLDEELLWMLRQKYVKGGHTKGLTPLDQLVRYWRQIFPGHDFTPASGELRFTNPDNSDDFNAHNLSDGEKAVIYYLGCALMTPEDAWMFVDTPDMFLHRSNISQVWDIVEDLRRRAPMVYVTHALDFASERAGRANTLTVWVKRFDAATVTWDYEILPGDAPLTEEIFLTLIGSRKPVLFVEGDGVRSIDAKLYPLVFREYTVKSLGSCDKVIEATRTFNGLTAFHSLDSMGIVDRDRRNGREVEYLRRKRILVADVAEIENMLMLEEVVRTVASHHGKDENTVFGRVKKTMLRLFEGELELQALLHTRHRVKMTAEHCIDRKFSNITKLELHLAALVRDIDPRGYYEQTCREFRGYVERGDYPSVLRVFNRKSMLGESNVAQLCGVKRGDKDGYINSVLSILRREGEEAERIRRAIKRSFGLEGEPLKP